MPYLQMGLLLLAAGAAFAHGADDLEAVAGPLKGRRLAAVDSGVHFAFAWLAFNPDSEIVRELP